jgi:hypothetical protein
MEETEERMNITRQVRELGFQLTASFTICLESSILLPGVRKLLLASLSDMRKTWKRMNICKQARVLISGIHYSLISVVEYDTTRILNLAPPEGVWLLHPPY